MRLIKVLHFLICIVLMSASNHALAGAESPIMVGLSAEFGVKKSAAAQSIEKGILLAIDEINANGGVLNGRRLSLQTLDDRGVSARGQDNLREFAANPQVLAVFSGRFSPVAIELAPIANTLKIPLLAPWSAADTITQHPFPNYVFRLSLTDRWAMHKILNYAKSKRYQKLALFVPNTAWGRGCEQALQRYQKQNNHFQYVSIKYNWGETDFRQKIKESLDFGADAIVMVSNESEGAPIVQQVAELPEMKRLPIIAHWGILGGDFFKLTGEAITRVELTVVQTFSFNHARSAKANHVAQALKKRFGITAEELLAQPGFAHAYDLTHLLAMAINQAGTTDREAVRSALERLGNYQGLVRNYQRPFSRNNHEALDEQQLFMGRFDRRGNIYAIQYQ